MDIRMFCVLVGYTIGCLLGFLAGRDYERQRRLRREAAVTEEAEP